MIPQVKLTARSSNRKTGPIATTISSAETCPATCPFNNGGGCYATSGPLSLHWRKVTNRETGSDLWGFGDQLKAAKLEPGTLLRWNVAGDLPHLNGVINSEALSWLVPDFKAYQLKAYTYTHHRQSAENLLTVAWCNRSGFTVNLSCDSEAQASARHREGFPAVCVVPSDDTRRAWVDEHGTRFQTCPAQLKDSVTCQTCKLCTVADRACVVAFRAHGTGRRKVDAALSQV